MTHSPTALLAAFWITQSSWSSDAKSLSIRYAVAAESILTITTFKGSEMKRTYGSQRALKVVPSNEHHIYRPYHQTLCRVE